MKLILIGGEFKRVFPIGMVAEVLGVSPGRLQRWEEKGLVTPVRKNGRRCYSELDLQRLMFIKLLLDSRQCKLAALPDYLAWYPCWQNGKCFPHVALMEAGEGTRPCWQKRNGWYCAGRPKIYSGEHLKQESFQGGI